MPEILKPLAQISEPDSRNVGWVIRNHENGSIRELTLAEHYTAVESLALSVPVHGDVVTVYNTARNVLLYSWYVYRFTSVAELQAYAALEYTLRWRFDLLHQDSAPTLAPLLERARREDLITDDTFRDLRKLALPVFTGNAFLDANIDPQLVEERGHVELLCKTLPRLRNDLAHGSQSVWPSAIGTFLVIKAAIERLSTTSALSSS